MIFENTIEVFLKGTEVVVEAENWSRKSKWLWRSVSWEHFLKVRRLFVVQHLESSGNNFELFAGEPGASAGQSELECMLQTYEWTNIMRLFSIADEILNVKK